jgi:hypothetical protein
MGRSKASANDAAAAAGKLDGEDESVLLKDDGGEPVDSVKVVGQQCIKAAKRSLLHSIPDLGRCKNLRQHRRPRPPPQQNAVTNGAPAPAFLPTCKPAWRGGTAEMHALNLIQFACYLRLRTPPRVGAARDGATRNHT